MLAEVIGQSVGGMNEQLARTPIGMMRQLAFTFGAIKEELGRGIMPVLQRVLPYLQSMAQWLLRVTQYVSAFLQALFGGSSQGTSAITAQTGAVSDLGDAYEDAGKKAQKSVSGFDQLNLVGAKSGGGDESTSVSTGLPGGLDMGDSSVSAAMDNVTSKAQEMAEKVKSAYGTMKDFIVTNKEPIIAALGGIAAALTAVALVSAGQQAATGLKALGPALRMLVSPIGLIIAAIAALTAGFIYLYRNNEQFKAIVDVVWANLKTWVLDVWNNVLVPFGAWLADVLPKAWDAIATAAKWLWDNVLLPFGAWLLGAMVTSWKAVTIAAEWLWKNVLIPFGNFLKWLWQSVLVPVGKIIGEVLAVAFKTVSDIAKSFWQNVLVPLGKALGEMFGPAVEAVSAVLKFLWNNVFVPFGKFIKTIIMPIVEGLIKVFEYLWKTVLKPLAGFIGDVFVSTFSRAFETIGGIIGGVKTIFIGLMNFITGIFTGDWKKAWEGVKDIFKGIFDTLWTIVKSPLNLIIDGVNAVILGINKFKIDIPDWVKKIPGVPSGLSTIGFNIPKIPKLDVGTNYVASDGLAFLHEGEAVVPKKYNPALGGSMDMREAVGVLKSILQAVKAGTNVEVNISQSEIGGAAVNYIRGEQRRTGRAPFPV
jgi:phage-related protein